MRGAQQQNFLQEEISTFFLSRWPLHFCLPKRGSDTFHSDGAVKDRGEAANEEQGRFEIQNVGKRFAVEETAVVVGNRLYLTTPA